MKREGQIKVDSENLFPIIKKWLYSDKDIFLREIVANGCDAIKKYQSLCTIGEAENDGVKPRIDIILDKDAKTLTVKDNGIGMTEEEVEKYITQVAFSGAQEFIEKYQDKTDAEAGIIGHFGLGFYSAYMVSDTVEIDSLSYQKDAAPVHWESDGQSTYEISDGQRTEKGTTVIMHFSEDGSEFCDSYKLRSVLKKYCHFMPYEIYFTCIQEDLKDGETVEESEQEPINITQPLWLKAPKDCTTEEYEDFYRELFPDINLPLFWIHLNVDYPFNLKGILFFPKLKEEFGVREGQIKLFSGQVFVADNIKEIIPEFLMLLRGVIDCPDIPLNVSRSFLQNDGYVKKISAHITKKVADKLTGLFNTERSSYEGYWDDIGPFVKYGCMMDSKFYDAVKDVLLFKLTDGKYKTLSEYKTDNEEKASDKLYYTSDAKRQAASVSLYTERGIDVAVLDFKELDAAFMNFMEYSGNCGMKFARVDADVSGLTEEGDEGKDLDENQMQDLFRKALGNETLPVKLASMANKDLIAMVTEDEQGRRMREAYRMKNMPESYSLVLNRRNATVAALAGRDPEDETTKLLCEQIYDLARMAAKPLEAEQITEFLARSQKIVSMLVK